ncbi:hypothetical protein HK104_006606, partial [Borealophlyctis nickersoniae]
MGGAGVDNPDGGSALEKFTSAFENALETAIENPWSLVPGWLRSSKAESVGGGHHHHQQQQQQQQQQRGDGAPVRGGVAR